MKGFSSLEQGGGSFEGVCFFRGGGGVGVGAGRVGARGIIYKIFTKYFTFNIHY